MDNKNIFNNGKDLLPDSVYLTDSNNYILKNGEIVYNGKYIAQGYPEKLRKLDEEAAELITQIFTVPINVDENNKLTMSTTDFDKIKHYIQNTQKHLSQNFDQKNQDTRTYEQEVYYLIGSMSASVRQVTDDKEIQESLYVEIEELLHSLQFYINKNYNNLIQEQKNNPSDNNNPIKQWTKFIQDRIQRFVDKQPYISSELEKSQKDIFEHIKTNALAHLLQTYQTELSIERIQQENYDQALETLQENVFQLNSIFNATKTNEDGSTEKIIQPIIKKLLSSIKTHIESISIKPETQFDFDIIQEDINLLLAGFYNTVYSHLTPDKKSANIMYGTINFHNDIYESVTNTLRYKFYKKISSEYKFVKQLLVQLDHESVKYPDRENINPIVADRFHEFNSLDKSIISKLKTEDLESLKRLALYYEQFNLLLTLEAYNLISKFKKSD